ncbi:MAG: hypothetical protein KDE08_02540 [Rhodobacteraceae bacterium]|nr:hypothetical protein [Paracoccaceae bacterium]
MAGRKDLIEDDEAALEARLTRIRQEKAARRRGPNPWVIAGVTGAAGLLIGGYVVAVAPTLGEDARPVETSRPAEFDGGTGLDGFVFAKEEPSLPQVKQEDPEIARLQALVDDLAARIDELNSNPVTVTDDAALAEMKRQNEELERQARMAQNALDAERAMAAQAAVEAQALATREAELQRQRAEAEAKVTAQITSDMIAFRGSSSGGGGAVSDMSGMYDGQDSFLRASAKAVETRQSEIIANPSNTILQGTVIEAALETAINSDLPGHISAIVTHDVWSWDMTRVLIPRGSKLFGRYASDVGVGQKRILIAWTRILTTDGQSVEIAAYGSDRLGRSGLPAKVRTHFLQKFGSAALLSIIGAAPDYAAAQSDREATSDVIQAMGDDLGNATDDAIGDYLSIPPTLSADQGAVVMIRVDSDIELF